MVSESQSAFVSNCLITNNVMVALEIFHTMKKRSKGSKGTMYVKLDMNKAYDRIEWDFKEAVLKKMGFITKWVNQIMSCVSGTKYYFHVNGKVRGNVSATYGLRQGDLISPYLFILVAKALSCLINQASMSNSLHGIRAILGDPCVSHLWFADDCLLFSRVSERECRVLVRILRDYEWASGQKVNFEKTNVSFSRGVREDRAGVLASMLDMRRVASHQISSCSDGVEPFKEGKFRQCGKYNFEEAIEIEGKIAFKTEKEILLKSVAQ